MKFRKMIMPMLMVIVALSLISCNYILENNNKKSEQLNKKLSRIETNKEEAKLLLKASENNLDILELCEEIKETGTSKNIMILAKNIEKTHIEISKNYNELAREKLISIPNKSGSSLFKKHKAKIDNGIYTVENLKLIVNKINNQIELLNTLSKITNNVEFKVLAIRDNFKLNYSKTKIENALSELKEPT